MIECTIQILTPLLITQREFGKRLYAALLSHFPNYLPQLYGDIEPIRKRFSSSNVTAALECWGSQFYVTRRRSPDVVMHVSFAVPSARPVHSAVSFIHFRLIESAELLTLKAFVLELSEIFLADYAMAHILTRSELDDWFKRRSQKPTTWLEPPVEQIVNRLRTKANSEGHARVLWETEIINLNTITLEKCLPNLYWLNVLGPAYVGLFGNQRVMSVPADSIEVLSYGAVAVQLAKELPDTTESWIAFKAVRETCVSHLDSNVLCNPVALKGHEYRTPQFVFGALMGAH